MKIPHMMDSVSIGNCKEQNSTNMKLECPVTEFDDTPLDLSVDCWSMAELSQVEALMDWSTHLSHSCSKDFVEYHQNAASGTPDMSPVTEGVKCLPSITFDQGDPSDSRVQQPQTTIPTPFGESSDQISLLPDPAKNFTFHQPFYGSQLGLCNQIYHEPVPFLASSSSYVPANALTVNNTNAMLTPSPDTFSGWNQSIIESTVRGDVDMSYRLNDNNLDATARTFPSERNDLDLSKFSNSSEEASRVLLFLGSTLRSKADKFVDASTIVDPRGNMRRAQGKELFFPDRLYQLLEMSEANGWTDIVSFQPHGRSFRVHDKASFVAKLLPICLQGQGSWSSFLRQLRLYGFTRCESGPDYGAYYHELFLRGRPSLTRYMRRVGVSHGGLDRRTFRLQKGTDPDFYAQYAPMPALNVYAHIDS
jgi:hypothetical protein